MPLSPDPAVGDHRLNGNVTGDGSNVYGWDAYQKLAWTAASGTPTCGTTGRCVVYDAFGRIVEWSNGSTWWERQITQLGESAYLSGATDNYGYWPAPGGGTVVMVGTSTYEYMHKDWLGSARFVSDLSNHSTTHDQAYSPYGELYDTFGASSAEYEMFAGVKGNVWHGVMWDTPNRELSVVGRWLSPDPAGTGWNQYAYPTNPNSDIDPSGLCPPGACGMGDNALWNFHLAGDLSGGCSLDGGGNVPCGMLGPLLGSGESISSITTCGSFCGQMRQDPDTGQWEQITGWQWRAKMDANGNAQDTLVPIWGDAPDPTMIAGDTALTMGARHGSPNDCLTEAIIAGGEDLLGLSMLPGSDQDNWQWSSDKFGFVYTGAALEEPLVSVSNGVDAVGKTADFVAGNSWAQSQIRQFLRSENVKVSLRYVSKDAALAGRWAGRAGKVLAAYSAFQRYKQCRGF